jgi:RNA polymerase sigma factor (sigma-70 family)
MSRQYPAPLPPDEQAKLCLAAQAGDKQARDRLILHSMRLVVSMARSTTRHLSDDAHEDLASEGVFGLIKAIEKWRPDSGANFATYAHHWVRHAISEASAAHQDKKRSDIQRGTAYAKRLRAAREAGLTEDEAYARVSRETGAGIETIRGTLERYYRKSISADVPVGEDGSATLLDLLGDGADSAFTQLEAHEQKALVARCVANLDANARERAIVEQRLMGDAGLADIGDRFHVSRERVRQIEAKLLPRLRLALRRALSGALDKQRAVSSATLASERKRIAAFAKARGYPAEWAEAVHALRYPGARETE